MAEQTRDRSLPWIALIVFCVGLLAAGMQVYASFLAAQNSWRTDHSVLFALMAAAAPTSYMVVRALRGRRK